MYMETGCGAAYEYCKNSGSLLSLFEKQHCESGMLQKEVAGLGFLASFARGVGSSLNSREVVTAAAKLLYGYFHYDLAVFSLPENSGRLTAFSARSSADLMNRSFTAGGGLPELKSWEMNDHVSIDPRNFGDRGAGRAIVEITGEEMNITLYCAEDSRAKAAPAILTGIAESLTTSLRNAREHERVKELSLRDGLTGLYNRRVLEELLTVEESRRTPAPVAVLILDIDDFKSINDTFGHPAGDRVLSVLGRLLQENCRKENIVARYGGEEFAVLLTNSGLTAEAAIKTAERLRKLLGSQNLAFSGRQAKLTVSVGVAFSNAGAATMKSLLERADEALYLAKRSGKNRVCFHEVAQTVSGARQKALGAGH